MLHREATPEAMQATLQEHDIFDVKTFLLMEKSDLAELFPSMGPRLRLWSLIQAERLKVVDSHVE